MRSKTYVVASAMLAVAIVIMGLSIRSGIVAFKEMDRTVTVKGLSEREVQADKVTWSLKYKEIGNDPSEMYQRLTTKNNTVVEFLKSGGIGTEEISINPPIISDRQADNYGNEIMNYRYRATSVITVTSQNVEKVRQLMLRQPELMRKGIAIVTDEYGDGNAVYEFTKLNEVKPTMVEEATKNARATAEKFAQDSGSGIGGIKTAQQGTFSIENRDANTPYIKKIRVVSTIEYALK